ncbi:MAG: alanine--glyoxylate aminotransferase family protein [Gemmatimonadota bacterium]|nr:alanine--glyoxylate aminotransferase family protein [Gemmatimonadota bacterium]
MPGLLPNVDPDGLLEYSVVYNDRTLNHMSRSFRSVMKEISAALKRVYNARAVVLVPGSGTYGMEAVARQFATGQSCLVIRNGWFSFRWTQILDMGAIPSGQTVLKARQVGRGSRAPFAPAPIEEVVSAIAAERPGIVFAPHVETASGMILPDDYVRRVADAVHEAGGMFVLDCIASGAVWVDMEASGADVLLSAPQKGWTGSPCCGLVMLGEHALERLDATTSTSYSCDLKKWLEIMRAYEGGAHAYHATMPTDGLRTLAAAIAETERFGLAAASERQDELGGRVRELLVGRGFPSVASQGFQAPGVVVSYTDDDDMSNGSKFAEAGVQVAGGVPLRCDEPADFKTFRVGLFGLDKLADVEGTVQSFRRALERIG